MVWFMIAICGLLAMILAAIKPRAPLGLGGTLRLGGIIMAWIVGGVIVLPLVLGLALLMFPS